jgi:MFS family permease
MGRLSERFRRNDLKIVAIASGVIGTIAGVFALLGNGPPYTASVVVMYVLVLGTIGIGAVALVAFAILHDIISDVLKHLASRRGRR